MPSVRSRQPCLRFWRPWTTLCVCSLTLAPGGLQGQHGEESTEALARVLALEDARRFDAALLGASARHTDPLVRRYTALALGRLGQGASILTELLSDPDSGVQANAAFSLGLLGDPAALPRLRQLVMEETGPVAPGLQAEAIRAASRIGGPEGARLVEDLLGRWSTSAHHGALSPVVIAALAEAWRLEHQAPVPALLPFASAPDNEARWRAVYTLARLAVPAAADLLLAATQDSIPLIRATAVRALTGAYAESTAVDRGALAARVRRLVEDPDAQVRIAALRALGTFRNPDDAIAVIRHTADPDPNVRVQALATLGHLGGPDAVGELKKNAEGGSYASRRQALLSLASASPASGLVLADHWAADRDWRARATSAEALSSMPGNGAGERLLGLTHDPDGRVAATALAGLIVTDSLRALDRARQMAAHPDPVVRTHAAGRLGAAADTTDRFRLVEMYGRGLSDPVPDARTAAIRALGRVAAVSRAPGTIADLVTRRHPGSDDYLVRRAAHESFPALAARWGPIFPVATGRAIGDYRDIAGTLLLPAARSGAVPEVHIETDRGQMTVALFPAESPLTVHAFLTLVERGYFDGLTWHRVVPGFVAQDGDPRGDGYGGPGFTLRDEIGRQGYGAGTVGLALDGPDTGGSQFFITVTPQPHLEGVYPVIGQVRSGTAVLESITQGERLRRIERR